MRMGRFLVVFLLLSKEAHAFGMMSKEKKAEEMTCDALMAKSLVSANEEKAAAESQRDKTMQELEKMTEQAEELQAELQAVTNDFIKRLNDANQRISQIKKESKEALEKSQKEWDDRARQYDMDMATLRDKAERSVADAKEQAMLEIRSLEDTHQKLLTEKEIEVVNIKTNYEKLASAIRAEALLNVTTIQTETEATREALVEIHKEEIANLKQEMKDKETASNRLVEETNIDAAARVKAAEEEARIQISDMSNRAEQTKQEHEQKLAKLKQEMKDKEEENKQLIADVKKEASDKMEDLEKNSTNEIARVMAQAKLKIHEAMEEVKETNNKLKQVKQERNDLEDKYEKATQKIAHWEALYGSRSYCNLTYIQEDALAAAVAAQKVVSHRAAKVTRKVIDSTKTVAEPQVKKTRDLLHQHVQPHVDAIHTLYKEHVDPHVQKHLVPFHKQYTAPLSAKLVVLCGKILAASKALASRGHLHLVTSYQSCCPKVLEQVTQLDAPSFMVTRVNLSCQDANKTVNAFLWTFGIVFMLIFRKFLWRSVIGIALLPFQILWFFSPLRLLFVKRKPSVEDNEVTTAPVKKEEPKKETRRVTRSAKVPQ